MKRIATVFSLLLCMNMLYAQQNDFAKYVNPMIGTGGHGHTFPGATVPFGMVQLSPDTRIDGSWDGCSGYHISDSLIYGFSHTHLSGTGCSDYGDMMIMPVMGIASFEPKVYASKFSHATEDATPGYYAVKLLDDNIDVELTATTRVGLHRYTFNSSGKANFIIDLNHRDKLIYGEVKVINDTTIDIYRQSEAWAKNQILYARVCFSKPVALESSISMRGKMKRGAKEKYIDGDVVKVAFSCNVKAGEKVLVKVALSPVSASGALKNMAAELPGWDFEKTRKAAAASWNNELGKIEITESQKDKLTVFYTALYHTMIQPNVNMDVDGMYRGMDNKLHKAEGFTYYSVFSLWDTFRAAHPLYTIIDKKRTLDFIKTFLAQYKEGGRLPVWELASNETDCMIGYHSVSVIADAAMKGIRDFDMDLALTAMQKSATWNHLGLPAYIDHGCITMDDEHESVSKTVEYAYDDWCIAQMASILKNEAVQKEYLARSQNWKNTFDTETNFMRPKKNGGWLSPFEPREVNNNFTEGNAWQYTFFVPQDIQGLINSMGGNDNFEKKLDGLFTALAQTTGREQADITGLIGQYAHGNEPSHHMAYLYNYIAKPSKTQAMVHKIVSEFYKPEPDGLIGNEDCGQMSAWYVLSALGIYEVTPGSNMYMIGTPLFSKTKVHLENGKAFTIQANNISASNYFIQSTELNGAKYLEDWISYADIEQGATIKFAMASTPKNDLDYPAPPQLVTPDELVINPVIQALSKGFKDKMEIVLKDMGKNNKLFYTINGQKPTPSSMRYEKPFLIDSTTNVQVIAVNEKGKTSFVTSGTFYKMPHADWKIKINSKYNSQYTAGGDEGLIDGMHGSENWRKGDWQGYQSQDFEAIIDFGKQKTITQCSSTYLQDTRSWIIYPTKVEYSFSDDGINFSKTEVVPGNVQADEYNIQVMDYSKMLNKPVAARFMKVKASNYGKLPDWHQGAGGDAFIFIDEINIR